MVGGSVLRVGNKISDGTALTAGRIAPRTLSKTRMYRSAVRAQVMARLPA
jgi:hypothetical protein